MDYNEDFTTVTIPFTTHSSTGAPVAPSSAFEAADIKIYKNGSATEKTTTNGVTMTSPFDSETGVHMVVIDTSNDTGDSGFWTAPAVYDVYLDPDETVDSVAVAKWIGQFTLGVTQAAVNGLLTKQMTEAYAADGVAPTLAQSLFLIQQMLTEMSISGTTMTIKKLDGSTTAATLTLNSATDPTSITRAS